MTTPLPAASPSAFKHDRESESRPNVRAERGLGQRVDNFEPRGRDGVARHERFRERLAGFEAGGGSGRAEDEPATLGEAIGKAQAQRQLRARRR